MAAKKAYKQLYRSTTSRIIGGVCGGISEYFEMDPTIVRLIFVVLGFASGSGIFIYLVLWLVIPTSKGHDGDVISENIAEIKATAKKFKEKIF